MTSPRHLPFYSSLILGRRSQPLRLLSVGDIPPEWGGARRGGTQTFHATLLEALSSPRLPVRCAGLVFTSRGEVMPDAIRRVSRRAFPIVDERDARRIYRRALRKARPDLVFFSGVHRPWGELARLHRRIAPQVPAIGIAHSWFEISRAGPKRSRRALIETNRAIRALNALALGSHGMLREGERLGIEYPHVTRVIPYPVSRNFTSPLVSVPPTRHGVLYAGSLIERKNVNSLIQAVASRQELSLVVAGEGPEEPSLRALADASGLDSRVRFVHHFPPGEHPRRMRELFRSAEIFCLPSVDESFGLVMTEALACGTPVAGFGPTLTEIEQLLGTACGAPIWNGSAEEIGEAIDRVRRREWNRRRLRRSTIRALHPRAVARSYTNLMLTAAAEARERP